MDAYEPMSESIVSQGRGEGGTSWPPPVRRVRGLWVLPNPSSVTGARRPVLTCRAFVRPGLPGRRRPEREPWDGARPGKRPSDSRGLRDLGAGVAGRRCRGCARGCPGKKRAAEPEGQRGTVPGWGWGAPCAGRCRRPDGGGRKDASTCHGRPELENRYPEERPDLPKVT